MIWVPVPTGEPISTAVLTGVASAIASLWQIFSGGVSKAVKTALEGLRGAINTLGDALRRLFCVIARALGKILTSLHTIWVRVIWPLLRQVPRIMGRLRRLIERDLPRLLQYIEKIREKVLEIYERFFRPLLVTIQRLRRMILVLRLLHIHWGDKLDAQLSRLQEKVLWPLKVVMEHIAVVEQWINAVVTAEQLIQETIFGWSVYHYQDPLVRSVLGAFTRSRDLLKELELWPGQSELPEGQSTAHLRQYLVQGSGPVAEDVAKALAELRRV